MILLSLQLRNALGRRQNERIFEKLSLLWVYYFSKKIILLFLSFELTVHILFYDPPSFSLPLLCHHLSFFILPYKFKIYSILHYIVRVLKSVIMKMHIYRIFLIFTIYIYIYYLVSNFVMSLLIECNFLGFYWFQDNFGLHQNWI